MGCLRQKVTRVTVLFLIVLSVFICCELNAYAAQPSASAKVCEGGVNVRTSYSTTANIVTAIAESTVVTVTKEKHTSATSTADTTRWYYIQSGSIKGWVRADCVEISYNPITATTTTEGPVNIRKGPETSYDSVGKAPAGTEVTVRLKTESASGTTWYKVLYNGYVRYIIGTYLVFPEESITENTNFNNEVAAFPSSYHSALRVLHEKYPAWHFKAKTMNYTWKDGLAEQMYSYKANTIPTSKPDGFKMVADGTYNFDTHTYIGLDGATWVAASQKAVAYYMDPRNWLDEINVFMFESLVYDPATQSESMVKSLLSETAIDPKYSSSYMKAGETYNISPVYLAAKSRLELGSYDYMVSGTKFTYNGKTYQGYYNAYNIGASDSTSGDAAKKGLVFAASGSSYLRPWKTLDLAIRGGAMYIAEDFIGNQQHTLYYERFNVANGLSAIGTHQYMTNTMAAATQANITYWEYEESDMLNTAFTFEIPVYQDMPASKAKEPGRGNNNCYLDSLKVYDGDSRKSFTASFNRFTSTYTLKNKIPYDTESLTVKAEANASDAKVTISGHDKLIIGDNKITVKVTSASGIVKRYYIKLTKSNATEVIAPEVKISNVASSGKPVLTWEAAPNADEYKVYRSTSKSGTYKLLKTITSCEYIDNDAVAETTYYYKVKSVGTTGVKGEKTSAIVYRACDLPQPVVTGKNRPSDGKPQMRWNRIDGAASYEVYRATGKTGTYVKVFTTTGTSYTHSSAKSAQTYYYKVRAISAVKTSSHSAYSGVVSRCCDLPQPVVTGKNRASDGKPRLTWKSVDGAASYEVYRATEKDGTYKRMLSTKGVSYTNTSAKTGQTYYYKVRAVSDVKVSAHSAYSEIITRTCDLPQPVVTLKARASDGKPRLTWKSIDGAASYEVYRATEKGGTYKKMITTKGASYTNTSAKAGQSYYYKVRALSSAKAAANSAYSIIKSIDVKK